MICYLITKLTSYDTASYKAAISVYFTRNAEIIFNHAKAKWEKFVKTSSAAEIEINVPYKVVQQASKKIIGPNRLDNTWSGRHFSIIGVINSEPWIRCTTS